MLDEKELYHLHHRSLPRVRTPEDRAALLHAAEVVGLSNEAPEQLAEERVRAILDAITPLLSAKGSIVGSYGAGWLWKLALKHEAAAYSLRKAASSRLARTRLIIVQYSGIFRTSDLKEAALVKEVLGGGLRDRSAMVRLFSADRLNGHSFVDLLPDLERALEIEQHPKALRTMVFARDCLAQGFHISSQPGVERDGRVSLSVRCKGSWCGVCIPKGDFEEVGAIELARRVRVRKDYLKQHGDQFDPLPPGYENAGKWPECMLNEQSA